MSLWKKALSIATSATLLASLFLTAAAGVASANTAPMALSGACVPVGCSQVVGTGSITMVGRDNTAAGAFTQPTKLTISGAGASFIHATGFTLETGTVFAGGAFYVAGEVLVPAGPNLSADDVTVIGATNGTATITEWQWIAASSVWAPDGNTWTLTFTAAGSFQVSAANSTVATVDPATITATSCGTAKTSEASTLGASTAALCVITKNAAGTALSGVTVSGTIQPFGLIGASQAYSGTTNANGMAVFPIVGSGLAGASTITANATFLNVTTPLTSATFTFTGALSKLTLTNVRYIYGQGELVASRAIKVVGTDSAGNKLDLGPAGANQCLTANITAATALTGLDLTGAIYATDGACYVWATTTAAAAFGTTAVTFSSTDDTITSNSVTLGVSDAPAAITAAFDKTTVIPGGTATFKATLKDSAGRLAPDKSDVLTVSSSGVAVDSSGLQHTGTLNGVATFTYLAPFNQGVASVTAFNADAGSASAAITVGAPAPITAGTNASALGVTKVGPFSTSTKIAALGKYETFKMTLGAGAAGKVVGILVATKNSAGVWSSFTRLTGRVADASGNVYFYWRSSSAKWISVRGSLDGVLTNTVQARWR